MNFRKRKEVARPREKNPGFVAWIIHLCVKEI